MPPKSSNKRKEFGMIEVTTIIDGQEEPVKSSITVEEIVIIEEASLKTKEAVKGANCLIYFKHFRDAMCVIESYEEVKKQIEAYYSI
jgi:hypothetical protein